MYRGCPKKNEPFFYFFFLDAQCVESGVSCTNWIFENVQCFSDTLYIDIYTLQLCIIDLTQRGWHTLRLKYPLNSLKSSSICLLLFPRLLFTSLLPSIFPSVWRNRLLFACVNVSVKRVEMFWMRHHDVPVIQLTTHSIRQLNLLYS